MSSDSTSAALPTNADELIAALTRIKDLSESDRDVVDGAAEMLAALREEVERLSQQVRWLAGKPYRPSREKVRPGQMALDLLQLLTGGGADEPNDDDESANDDSAEPDPSADDSEPVTSSPRRKRTRRGRTLAREILENRVPESDRRCPCCGDITAEIGFDTQERFVYQPAKVFILEERCYKYACRRSCGGVTQAEASAPPKPIPGSMASSSLLAHLLVSKLMDGLPIERVAKQLRRHGVDLATSTLNDWINRAGDLFAILDRLFREELRRCSLISLDDTPMRAKARGQPTGIQRGRVWIYLGDLDRVAYVEFTPDWKGTHPRRVLEGFQGDIQNDGYAGINPLFVGDDAPRRVGCNGHSRRKFVQALEQGDQRAHAIVDLYRALYRIEAEIKTAALDADGTLARRRAASVPIWNQLADAIAALTPTAGRKSPLGKAVTYWNRQLPYLRAFLDDGRLPISNAHVERRIRTVALFRKNSLVFGSVDAGARHATLLTLLLNCELVGANPYEYLVDVIDKLSVPRPASRAAELLPRAWLEARQAEHELNRDTAAAAD